MKIHNTEKLINSFLSALVFYGEEIMTINQDDDINTDLFWEFTNKFFEAFTGEAIIESKVCDDWNETIVEYAANYNNPEIAQRMRKRIEDILEQGDQEQAKEQQ